MAAWYEELQKAAERLGGGVLSALGALADWSSSPYPNTLRDIAGAPKTDRPTQMFGNDQGGYDLPWGTYHPSDALYGAVENVIMPTLKDEDIDKGFNLLSVPSDWESDVLASAILYVTGQSDWSKAWDVTHNASQVDQISPGQALFAPIFGGQNAIEDRAKLNGSPLYNFATGIADAANTIFLDPTVVGGKFAKAGKVALATRPIAPSTTAEKVASKVLGTGFTGQQKATKVAAYQSSESWKKFKEFVQSHDEGDIAALMPNNEYATHIAAAMKMAKNDQEMDWVGRIALGDPHAIKKLTNENESLAASIDVLNHEMATLLTSPTTPYNRSYIQTRIKGIQTILADKEEIADWNDRLMTMGQTLDVATPGGYRLFGKDWGTTYRFNKLAKDNAKSLQQNYTGWLQGTFNTGNPLTPAVRMMRPGTAPTGWLNLNRADGDINELSNMLNLTPLDEPTKGSLLDDYRRQYNTRGREASALKIEKAAIASVAKARGYHPEAVDAIVRDYLYRKGLANKYFRETSYSSATYNNGLGADVFEVDGVATRLPLHPGQTSDVLRLADIQQLDEILRKAHIREGIHNALLVGQDLSKYLGDFLSGFWKTSVLLRLGFPIRVLTDDQTRILSKMGALAFSKMWGARGKVAFQNSFYLNVAKGVLGKEMKRDRILGAGYLPKTLGGKVEDAWGASDKLNMYYGQAGSEAFWESMVDVQGKSMFKELSKSGRYKTLTPEDIGYHEAWLHSINDILLGNPIVGEILKGRSDDYIVAFLRRGSPAARRLKKQVPHFAGDPRDWVARIRADVENTLLTGVSPELGVKARGGTLTLKDLEGVPKDLKPFINGEAIEHNLGGGPVNKFYTNTMNRLYKLLGQMPTDTLSRHPYFVINYRARIQKLAKDIVEVYPEDQVPAWYMKHMETQAREYALKQTKSLLFDISSRSSIAHSMRFISPFFSAWQDSFNTWLGLAKRDPSLFPRSISIWNAPNKMGEYERDAQGNVVTDDKGRPKAKSYWGFTLEVTDKDGNPVTDNKLWFLDPEQQVRIQLPSWLGDSISGGMTVDISKGSLFSIAQGDTPWLPGGGPLVNVAAGALLKNKPQLEDSLHFLLPYGAPRNLLDTVLPASFKNIYQAVWGDSDDQAFAQTQFMVMQAEIVRYNQGLRASKPTWPEIQDRASAMWKLKVASSLVLPFAPSYKSPYQWYIDQYHKYERLGDPSSPTRSFDTSPDEQFYEKFGDTLYILTSSLTKNVAGVPATKEAFALTNKYRDLIQKDPELGRLIIGPAGQGDFSSSVYRWQFDNEITPGSGQHFRELQKPGDALNAAETKLGWVKYRQFINSMSAQMKFDGLASFDDPGAEDYKAAKDQYVATLAESNPKWFEDFSTTNPNKMTDRIATMEKLVDEPKLRGDPMRQDIHALSDYLTMRRRFVAELKDRTDEDSKTTLDAKKNADLKEAWEQFQSYMVGVNTMFSDLFYSYLEFDRLQY